MSKQITKEKAREMFLNHIHDMVEFWANESRKQDPKRKLDGLVFSILALIDGSGMGLPAMDIVLRPHPEDKEFHQKEDEDWFEDGMVINDDCHLHEFWHKEIK